MLESIWEDAISKGITNTEIIHYAGTTVFAEICISTSDKIARPFDEPVN